MKKFLTCATFFLLLILNLTGCSAIGDKSANLSNVYGATAITSLLLLAGCILLVRQKSFWFVLLFSSVFVVNTGYTLLSVSSCLEMALWSNRISYFGSVFLPFSMLMIILNITDTKYKKYLPKLLFAIAILIFLIAASPGILPIYYKEVSFNIVNNVSTLVKIYGPLHPLYFLYLIGYFSTMVAVIVRAYYKKYISTTAHAIIIAIAVFVNICVWFIEQLVHFDFEFLSLSYIISELFLLGIHLVITENQRLQKIVGQVEFIQDFHEDSITKTDFMLEKPIHPDYIDSEHIKIFMNGLEQLTPTEKIIFDAYISRVTTKEILANLNIKESTLKYHNRNLYGKLGVSTRKELLELYKYIKSIKVTFVDTCNSNNK